ncbi:hypothetical protein DL98DRAFT_29008 [Cadophora sp. DSE1049]|nr:hypothetical protein DL98DRAFT_29008 [Cadophora sp. DSE1049]
MSWVLSSHLHPPPPSIRPPNRRHASRNPFLESEAVCTNMGLEFYSKLQVRIISLSSRSTVSLVSISLSLLLSFCLNLAYFLPVYFTPKLTIFIPSINDDSRLEKNLERGYKGNWHLSSMIFVFSEGEDGSISEGLQGGIIYHNYVLEEGTRAPALGQFLSGELVCAIAIITCQILSLMSSTDKPTLLKEYSVRCFDFFLRNVSS